MYKLIRLFAPVVLAFFFCGLFAGTAPSKAFGETPAEDNAHVDYTLTYSYPGFLFWGGDTFSNPKPDEDFLMTISANYDHKSIEHLKIKQLDSFEIESSQTKWFPIFLGLGGTRWSQEFKLHAPKEAGSYKCIFEGQADDKPFFFSSNVKVDRQQESSKEMLANQMSSPPVIIMVIVVGVVMAVGLAVLFSSMSKSG